MEKPPENRLREGDGATRSRWRQVGGQAHGAEPALPSLIPPDLLRRLEGLRSELERQGIVQRRRGKNGSVSFRLRYRAKDPECGRRRQFTLSLGSNPRVADAVEELLFSWRGEYWRRRVYEARERMEARKQRAKMRKRRSWCTNFGHSRRQRQLIGREFDRICHDPRATLRFLVDAPHRYSPPRRGRPPKHALW